MLACLCVCLFLLYPIHVQAQNLGGQGLSSFGEAGKRFPRLRRLPIGASVELVFDDNFTFSIDSSLEKNRTAASVKARTSFLNFLNLQDLPETSRKITIRSRDRSDGRVSAIITDYNNDSDTYSLQVFRNLLVNNKEEETFILTGEINAEAVDSEGRVMATKLANVLISYNNHESSELFALEDFESFAFEPPPKEAADLPPALGIFPQTLDEYVATLLAEVEAEDTKSNIASTELSKTKKRELFLRFVNELFQDWF